MAAMAAVLHRALTTSDTDDSDLEDLPVPGLNKSFSMSSSQSSTSGALPEFSVGQVVWAKAPHFQYWPSRIVGMTGKGKKTTLTVKQFNSYKDGKTYRTKINLAKPSADAKPFLPADKDYHEGYKAKALLCPTFKNKGGEDGPVRLDAAIEDAIRHVQKRLNDADASSTGQ